MKENFLKSFLVLSILLSACTSTQGGSGDTSQNMPDSFENIYTETASGIGKGFAPYIFTGIVRQIYMQVNTLYLLPAQDGKFKAEVNGYYSIPGVKAAPRLAGKNVYHFEDKKLMKKVYYTGEDEKATNIYSYNSNGLISRILISSADSSSVITFEYDEIARSATMTREGNETVINFNEYFLPSSMKSESRKHKFEYNADGKIARIAYSYNSSPERLMETSFIYDSQGRLTQVMSDEGQKTFEYGEDGRCNLYNLNAFYSTTVYGEMSISYDEYGNVSQIAGEEIQWTKID